MLRRSSLHGWARRAIVAGALVAAVAVREARAQEKPNVLVIFGDDVGITNISAYSSGLMGYEVGTFAATFMEETLDDIRDARRRAK